MDVIGNIIGNKKAGTKLQGDNLSKNKQLSEKQVDKLYKDTPYLENPNYPKKLVKVHDKDETHELLMKVKGKKYKVMSSPVTGEDKWYKL